MAVELLVLGIPLAGILERIGSPLLPPAVIKYLWCCPNMDFNFRCLPRAGGLYDQRMRDFIDFNLIEQRLREIRAREISKK